jgi:diacylglycerol kinase (ATP)
MGYSCPMRAVALLGLNSTEKNVADFRLPGVEVAISPRPEAADAALIFGGDGTVHRHLERLHELQAPALMVPTGSGNDFAHALGIRSVADALAAWKKFVAGQGSVRQIDLGCIEPAGSQMANGKWQREEDADPSPAARARDDKGGEPSSTRHLFCCVGGVGLDAEANRHANAMPRWLRRRGGYILAAAMAIIGKHRTHMRAFATSTAGEPLLDADELAEMVVFANASSYGDGLLIAPGAKLDDGKLDLIYVRRASRLRLLQIAPTVLRGTHIRLPEVWFARAAEVRVESDPPRMIYADGEPICLTPTRVGVIPNGLQVITN